MEILLLEWSSELSLMKWEVEGRGEGGGGGVESFEGV